MTEGYDRLGVGYLRGRLAEPRWQAALDAAVGSARTVLNVGAGTGSYEPADRRVLAVEPSALMIKQRGAGAAPALQAYAEHLPIADSQFEVGLAIVTLHHWTDWRAGLHELRRVAARTVIVHFDPVIHAGFWLARDYLPELAELWREVPTPRQVAGAIGEGASVQELPVPWDCVDGFLPAYWRRPEAYLDPLVRQAMSGLQLISPTALVRGIASLQRDLDNGTWRRNNADLLGREQLDVGWRLITG